MEKVMVPKYKESLGLILIETLTKKQLKAQLTVNSSNGVKVEIR